MSLSKHYLKELCDEGLDFHFRYYSDPQKWKEKIISIYHNDIYSLWCDGWLEKIKYCDLLSG